MSNPYSLKSQNIKFGFMFNSQTFRLSPPTFSKVIPWVLKGKVKIDTFLKRHNIDSLTCHMRTTISERTKFKPMGLSIYIKNVNQSNSEFLKIFRDLPYLQILETYRTVVLIKQPLYIICLMKTQMDLAVRCCL